jgi:hypothetical protein
MEILTGFFKFIWYLPRNVLALLIKGYQKILSPDHGVLFKGFYPNGYCKYHPSCSSYAYESVKKYGVVRGGSKAAWRILRCNPWSKGGDDPVK